jgi:hypothetical protein
MKETKIINFLAFKNRTKIENIGKKYPKNLLILKKEKEKRNNEKETRIIVLLGLKKNKKKIFKGKKKGKENKLFLEIKK